MRGGHAAAVAPGRLSERAAHAASTPPCGPPFKTASSVSSQEANERLPCPPRPACPAVSAAFPGQPHRVGPKGAAWLGASVMVRQSLVPAFGHLPWSATVRMGRHGPPWSAADPAQAICAAGLDA